MKKNILIDGRAFSLQEKGGVSQLWAKIIGCFIRESFFNLSLFLYPGWNKNIHLKEIFDDYVGFFDVIYSDIPPSDNLRFSDAKHASHRAGLIADLIPVVPDMVVNTYYGENVFPKCSNYLIVAHDFAHEELDILSKKESTASVIKRKSESFSQASCVVFVSGSTRDKGLLLYPELRFKNNFVILHGHDDSGTLPNKNLGQYIHVGTRSGYKRFDLVVQAFRLVFLTNGDISLVVAGGENIDNDTKMLADDFPGRVSFFQGISDEKMDYLVASSEFFISASEYEGFGIPVLNALRFNTIPILSDIPVYREVGGSQSVFFEKGNSESLFNAIEKISCDFNFKNTDFGVCRSWNVVGSEYFEVIQRCIDVDN